MDSQDRNHKVALSPQPLYPHYGSVGSGVSSYFDYNFVDVIMDDGSRQKRTVSLSTLPRPPSTLSTTTPGAARHSPPTRNTGIGNQQESSPESDDSDGELANSDSKSPWIVGFAWSLTTGQQRVLKCSLAYIIGCLFTFVPVLHQWMIGEGYDQDGGRMPVASHMAATVTVFFLPSKTVGGMVEAAGVGWVMTLGALLVCLASLWTTDWFLGQLDQPYVSYGVTLFGWLLTSVLLLAFLKAHYSNRPSVTTASSLAFIVLFPILVREHTSDESQYSRQRIQDTFAIVAIGSTISVIVCFFIWPQTATKKFNANMNQSLLSLRVLLKLLTKTFLLDADLPDFKANKSLAQAIRAHDASFTTLQSSLEEARLEWWWWWSKLGDKIDGVDAYESMVKSTQRLALHIGGLRKSCGLQFDRTHPTRKESDGSVTYHIRGDDHRRKFERTLKREHSTRQESRVESSDASILRSTNPTDYSDGLVSFIRTVGPSLKSLAFTCKQTLIHLQQQFVPESNDTPALPSFVTLRHNLELALGIFEQQQQKALTRLYRRYAQSTGSNKGKNADGSDSSFSHATAASASPTEWPWMLDPSPSAMQSHLLSQLPEDDLFLVYFFVYCLIAFAKELVVLVTYMEHISDTSSKNVTFMSSFVTIIKYIFIALRCKATSISPYRSSPQHSLGTLHNPTPQDTMHAFRMGLWGFLTWFRKYQVRYAIKAGLAAVALASLAFIPSTQTYFKTYRMEWTLITVMAAMAPTVGGTNFVAILRIAATILGAIAGASSYSLLSGYHVVWLILLTWLISLPCFWMILHQPKYGRFGQFFLLAYNLVVLFRYNHPDTDIFDLAYQRCVAVCLGVTVGLVVSTYMWPYEARKEVRYGLSDLLLKLSWQYYRLNGSSSTTAMAPDIRTNEKDDTTLLDLQQHIYHLSGLLKHTPNEPRLKGRFPFKTYYTMLDSCQSILNNMVMIQMVLLTDQRLQEGHHRQGAWTDLVGNVVLYFYVLASALLLKTPLPPYLPPADMARKQLISRLSSSPATGTTTAAGYLHDASSSSYMTYYAYVVLMETLLYDMDQLADHMKALYGSMIPSWHP